VNAEAYERRNNSHRKVQIIQSRIIKSVNNSTKLWCMIKYISKGMIVFVTKKRMLKHKDNENAILKQKKT
jgi:hypothetical protein